jgi:radical SAM protein with 4Fe4S-binding SPASM domain
MPVNLFTEVIEKINIHTTHIYLHVKGEPLLHPDLSEMLDLCHKKKLEVNLVTNGTLLADKGEMLLTKPALRQINISLHCYSDLPNHKNKDDYVKTVIEFTKKALSQSQTIISLRFWNIEKMGTNLNPDNQTILKEIEKEFAPGKELKDLIKPGQGYKLRKKFYVNSDFKFAWPNLEDSINKTKGFCYALHKQIAILSDGTVVPCCLDTEGIINLGNIQENDLQQIFMSERAQKIYHGFSNKSLVEPLCQNCQFIDKFN